MTFPFRPPVEIRRGALESEIFRSWAGEEEKEKAVCHWNPVSGPETLILTILRSIKREIVLDFVSLFVTDILTISRKAYRQSKHKHCTEMYIFIMSFQKLLKHSRNFFGWRKKWIKLLDLLDIMQRMLDCAGSMWEILVALGWPCCSGFDCVSGWSYIHTHTHTPSHTLTPLFTHSDTHLYTQSQIHNKDRQTHRYTHTSSHTFTHIDTHHHTHIDTHRSIFIHIDKHPP